MSVSFGGRRRPPEQGWAINPDDGAFHIRHQRSTRRVRLHSGDTIYADGIIPAAVKLADGKTWKNLTIPEKAKVAETLYDSRGAQVQFPSPTMCAPSSTSAEVPILRAVGRPLSHQQLVRRRNNSPPLQWRDINLLAARAGPRIPRDVNRCSKASSEPGRSIAPSARARILDVFMLG